MTSELKRAIDNFEIAAGEYHWERDQGTSDRRLALAHKKREEARAALEAAIEEYVTGVQLAARR